MSKSSTNPEGSQLAFAANPPGKQRTQAFTLVELLVSLAIIAILSALLFGVVQRTSERGMMAQSANNLRQLVAANTAYATENGRFAPADSQNNLQRWHGARASISAPFDPTKGFLSPYLGNSRRVTTDPLFKKMVQSSHTFEMGTGGYGYNEVYIGGLPTWEWDATGVRVAETPARVMRRASTVMFTTSGYAQSDGLQEYPYCEPPFWDFGTGPTEFRPSPTVHFRFNGKALVGWCDGHVSAEAIEPRTAGFNPTGGDPDALKLGWFGPDADNGYWNPQREGF